MFNFLENVPSILLQRTGIGQVFHDALMPCLLYLPSLTEEQDSLILLNSSYPCIFALTKTRHPHPQENQTRFRIYDSILRGGIFRGFALAGEHPNIALLLFEQLEVMSNELDLAICKHLKVSIRYLYLAFTPVDCLFQHVLPLINRTLSQPFAAVTIPLVRAAIRTLRAIIENAWPRMNAYRIEVWRCLMICWCRLDEEHCKDKDIAVTQKALLDTLGAMKGIVKRGAGSEIEFRTLIEADSGLSDLLVL